MSKRKTLGDNNPLAGLSDDPLDWIGRAPSKDALPPELEVPEAKPVTKKATYQLRVDLLEDVRDAAYWSRQTVNEIASELIQRGIASYEAENGELKPRPDREG